MEQAHKGGAGNANDSISVRWFVPSNHPFLYFRTLNFAIQPSFSLLLVGLCGLFSLAIQLCFTSTFYFCTMYIRLCHPTIPFSAFVHKDVLSNRAFLHFWHGFCVHFALLFDNTKIIGLTNSSSFHFFWGSLIQVDLSLLIGCGGWHAWASFLTFYCLWPNRFSGHGDKCRITGSRRTLRYSLSFAV